MATAAAGKSPAQMFALVFGAIYVLVGLLGFVNDPILGIFDVNLLHNIIHLAVGGLFLYGGTNAAATKQVNLIIGVVYLLVGVLGLVNVVVPDLIVANNADDFLHLATGALALYFGTAGAGAKASPPATA